MKLQELAYNRPTEQIAKVLESFFDKRVSFDSLNQNQAITKLRSIRKLVKEYRQHPSFHRSEQSPAYLKAIMMEQALSNHLMELDAMAPVAGTAPVDPAKQAAMATAQAAEKKRSAQDQIKQIDTQIAAMQKQKVALQQQMNAPTMAETYQRYGIRLTESEVQQAQVVLAAQDLVDKMQGMLEDVTELQFKELPPLVDSIKNQVGVDQAAQFNNDAASALSGLVQNLQGAKQQMEAALGVVTGQSVTSGNDDMGMDMDMDMQPVDDLGIEPDQELGGELPSEEEPEELSPAAALGRGRR